MFNIIDLKLWHEHYCDFYYTAQQPRVSNVILRENSCRSIPELDTPISLDEIIQSLGNCKANKAPGDNGISSEFFKYLPNNWLLYMNVLFNKIIEQEKTPKAWSNIVVKMLYKKKGDKRSFTSYRPIALVNTIVKIFTQTIHTRVIKWCDTNNKLPEWQSGFRADRSCLDNIYTLNTVIQLHLRKERGKLYALFVDFKGAFDNVRHDLLWEKLWQLGMSTKFIKIMADLYSKAEIKISDGVSTSETIKVTRGVLQGETLSPLLFALFLQDLEIFLKSKGLSGVSVTHVTEILLLGYADDIVILSDSYIGIKKSYYTYMSTVK